MSVRGDLLPAITSLDDTEERASLEAALARAEHLASIPPVDEDAEAFIVRAKKRIAAESAKIVEAEKQKKIFEQELAQAEKDLIGFRQEAEMQAVVQVLRAILCLRWRPTSRQSLAQLRGSDKRPIFHVDPASNGVCRTGERVPTHSCRETTLELWN